MGERTLLFSDVVASTELVQRLGDVSAAQVWASHDRRARDLMMLNRGREIDRTDGFFLLFDEAADAACYALEYHKVLNELGLSGRVGIHVGAVTLRENTPEDIGHGAKPVEVEGLAKPLAARIMALAHGGQTLVSASARNALANVLPAGGEVWKHGHYRLKGIEEPVELFGIGAGDSSLSSPADSDKAYRVVRTGDLWRPVREVRHNLPAERDAFIGRGSELRALTARLDVGVRLLTLLGAAGTGKTRFVRRYGLTCLGDWPGGIYFCDLSEAQTLDGIFFAVASALEVPLGQDDPAVRLGHVIAARGRCLVVLDNFEQIVGHASATLGLWLDRAAAATFVVTSRELLHLPGEEIFPVEPLSLKTEAIELFAVRAREQDPNFSLGRGNRGAVTEIVRMLDGLPLAIELAAARIRLFSPAQLVQRMRDRFSLLAGKKGAAARQATLRAAIDWSWELLPVFEQAAFAQCAVFEGGFTLEAAEAVLDLTPWPGACSAADAVQALVDKSLLRTWVPVEQRRYGVEETYFGMYISIHEYAVERLHDSVQDAGRGAEERHGEYFATFGTDGAIDALSLHGGAQRRRALALELDNLVAACRRASSRGDVGTACAAYRATWEVLELHGPYALGAELGWQLVGLTEGMSASLRAIAGWTLGQTLKRAGRLAEARPWLVQTLALARDIGDPRREGSVLNSLGGVYRQLGRMADSRASFEAALALSRRAKDRRLEGFVLAGLAAQRAQAGQFDAAGSDLEAALIIAREVGDRRVEGMVARNLGANRLSQGDESAGFHNLEVAKSIAIELRDLWLQSAVVGTLGEMNALHGHTEEGLTQLSAAVAMSREIGDRSGEVTGLGALGEVHRRQGRKGESEEHFAAALAIAREIGNPRFQGSIHCSFGDLRRDQGLWDEARAEYEASLAVARAVNDRVGEGAALSKLGALLAEQRQLAEARSLYGQALALAREADDRVLEGEVLGNLGGLLAKEGQLPEAIEALRTGEALLRNAVNREGLAKILCIRGRADVSVGQRSSAYAALVEAEALSATMHSAPDTELGQEIAMLREALA